MEEAWTTQLEETETDGGIHPSQEQLIEEHLSALLSPTEKKRLLLSKAEGAQI